MTASVVMSRQGIVRRFYRQAGRKIAQIRAWFLSFRGIQCALVALLSVYLVSNVPVGGAINVWYSLWGSTQVPSLGLQDYRLIGEPVALNEITHNGSGLTYNPDTNTLFAIMNNPTKIVEMTLTGDELRSIELKGFDDTEGLTYLGKGRYALVEEEHRGVVIVDIDANTEYLLRSSGSGVAFSLTENKNKGFEGIAYNSVDKSLFVVNEKLPRVLYRLDGVVEKSYGGISIANPWSMEDHSLGKQDLSGLHFLSDVGNLLILSDESKSITETSVTGERISTLSLRSGSAGLSDMIPQPEGVTVDHQGHLYILSEPNLLYRFAPPTPQITAR